MTMPSIHRQLERILHRVGDQCDAWKDRDLPKGVMGDVYEGKVWQEWREWLMQDDFLSLGFSLNCDWFQPYKYSQYSAGALYMVVLNLPREIRYKKENVILVGMLPRVHEHTNSTMAFTEPLVNVLLPMYTEGVSIGKRKIRGALLCISCDLPAGRSLVGFSSCTAKTGCPRCHRDIHEDLAKSTNTADAKSAKSKTWRDGARANRKLFQNGGVNMCGDEQSARKTNIEHRANADLWKKLKNKTQRQDHVKKTGSRWSPFLRLPYFDAVRFLVIDGMHCLFLGIVKDTINALITEEYFSDERFAFHLSKLQVPRGKMGRMMAHYELKMRKMTADEYMTFSLYFSDEIFNILLVTETGEELTELMQQQKTHNEDMKRNQEKNKKNNHEKKSQSTQSTKEQREKDEACTKKLEAKKCLLVKKITQQKNKIKQGHKALKMWKHLSEALRGVCSHVLLESELPRLQAHLYHFMCQFEALFGSAKCKPNFHFSQELLKEVLYDYGPMHVTWCFAFERLNGILGDQKHNFRDLERILPRRFLALQVDLRNEGSGKHDFLRHKRFDGMWANLQPDSAVSPAMRTNRATMQGMKVKHKYDLYCKQGMVAAEFGVDSIFWEDVPACMIKNVKVKAPIILLELDIFELLKMRLAGSDLIPKQFCDATANSICIYEDTVGSANSATWKNSFIISKFYDRDAWHEWAGQVQQFYEISCHDSEGNEHTKLMAYVQWYDVVQRVKAPKSVGIVWERMVDVVYSEKFGGPDQFNWISVTEITGSFVPCYLKGTNGNFVVCRVRIKAYH